MKALVLKEYDRLVYEDVPEPQIAPDEVLVQVKACGICGSDVHRVDGSTGRRIPPIIMGHEAAGVIAEVGSDVSGWQTGDRVTFDITVFCGRCFFCRRGLVNLCDNLRILGVSTPDFRMHGAFAEYVAIPHQILYRLPEKLSFERAAMMEAVSVAAHAIVGTTNATGESEACLEMMASGEVDVDTLISAVAPLAEGVSWFERLREGEAGLMKVILT